MLVFGIWAHLIHLTVADCTTLDGQATARFSTTRFELTWCQYRNFIIWIYGVDTGRWIWELERMTTDGSSCLMHAFHGTYSVFKGWRRRCYWRHRWKIRFFLISQLQSRISLSVRRNNFILIKVQATFRTNNLAIGVAKPWFPVWVIRGKRCQCYYIGPSICHFHIFNFWSNCTLPRILYLNSIQPWVWIKCSINLFLFLHFHFWHLRWYCVKSRFWRAYLKTAVTCGIMSYLSILDFTRACWDLIFFWLLSKSIFTKLGISCLIRFWHIVFEFSLNAIWICIIPVFVQIFLTYHAFLKRCCALCPRKQRSKCFTEFKWFHFSLHSIHSSW